MGELSATTIAPSGPNESRIAQLEGELEPLVGALLAHPIYHAVASLDALRVFMRAHVFAVWDFMSLLKSLQRRLTCVELPWTPPTNARAARLINEIVLAEESDEVAPGRVSSHYALYLEAMADVGADSAPVADLLQRLRHGTPAERALESPLIPACVKPFVAHSLHTARSGSDAQVAASFLYGREDLVPQMFRRLLCDLEPDAPSFRLYLSRHIELDEGEHGPAAKALLGALCGESDAAWHAATEAARTALQARIALWDGVHRELPTPQP